MAKRKLTPEEAADAELELRNEWAKARKAFVAAKDNRGTAEYRKAKAQMSELRTYWRQIRDAVTAESGTPPVASPAPIQATAAVNKEG
jgi:hypothetical protein